MQYRRMPIEVESPEELGYATIRCNLAESSVRDIRFKDLGLDLGDLVIAYGEHRGALALRQTIAADSPGLSADDVLVCPGAATALFIISTTLLRPDDHLIVIRPNYATNIETPRAIGCAISTVDLSFEDGFQLDPTAVREALRPNTKLISLTTPHNPTGTEIPQAVIRAIADLARERGIRVLVDETYRYLNFQTPLRPYAAELGDHVISVCSLSKAFGAPGIRIGWLINSHAALQERFLAAKEQIIIANSVVDEAIALHLLQNGTGILREAHAHILSNFNEFKKWMQDNPWLEWVEPAAGVVAFPRIKTGLNVELGAFYRDLYEQHQTVVGPGHWFEQDDRYMRIGFAFPTANELREGLENIARALEKSIS